MSRTLILFAKNPEPGKVKTRLSPGLSPTTAAELARAFLRDSATLLRRAQVARRVVAFSPATSRSCVESVIGEGFEFEAQVDGDLGNRMRASFEGAFSAGASEVVIVGADSPTLPSALIEEAFMALRSKDVVLGPALDSGYYLIGLRRPVAELFRSIPWGGEEVLPRTLAVIREEQASLHLLPPWFDVDTPEDLEFLRVQVEALKLAGELVPEATTTLLERLGP